MLYRLTEQEKQDIICTLVKARQCDDGYYTVDMPAAWLGEIRHGKDAQEPGEPDTWTDDDSAAAREASAPLFTFDEAARIVRYDRKSVRLSPTQFALLQYVYTHGKSCFHDLACEVWQSEATPDKKIHDTVYKTNLAMVDAEFGVQLTTSRGYVAMASL